MFQNIFEYTVKRAPALVDNISSLLEQTMLDPVSSTKDKVCTICQICIKHNLFKCLNTFIDVCVCVCACACACACVRACVRVCFHPKIWR